MAVLNQIMEIPSILDSAIHRLPPHPTPRGPPPRPPAPLRWLQGRQECWFDSIAPDFYHPTSDTYLDMVVGEVLPAVQNAYRWGSGGGGGSVHVPQGQGEGSCRRVVRLPWTLELEERAKRLHLFSSC